MKLQILSVFDRKMNAYGDPFPAHTVAAAIRGFTDAVNDPKSPMHRHPEDYDLFHIAEYDTNNASFNTTRERNLSAASQHQGDYPYMVAQAQNVKETPNTFAEFFDEATAQRR